MIDFDKRLRSLKDRRQGTREMALMESFDSDEIRAIALANGMDIRTAETFEKIKESSGVKYAIGAMAPVSERSTALSIKEGNRVADSLISDLNSEGENVTKRLQGSVALDIHINGHSDVDMLILVNNPVNIEIPLYNSRMYSDSSDSRSLISIARDVRRKSEKILPSNFPKAKVNCSGSKSIAISGGSLTRKVDVVPAIWFDSITYQKSQEEHDRGVKIYDKDEDALILNHPFLHIKRVNDRDAIYSGNLKCCVRLMKNMVADMPDYKKTIAKILTSYDLASIAYHMESQLAAPPYMRLSLVERIRDFLWTLSVDRAKRDSLIVPDNSRMIFNEARKIQSLLILQAEFEDLAKSIFKELEPLRIHYDPSVILRKTIEV